MFYNIKNIKFADLELCLIDFPSLFFQLKGLKCSLKTNIQKASLFRSLSVRTVTGEQAARATIKRLNCAFKLMK
jgi:hypothetical protein